MPNIKSLHGMQGATSSQIRKGTAVNLAARIVSPEITFVHHNQRAPTCASDGCPRCKHGSEILQTKLKIGAPNYRYEIEADRMAVKT